MIREQRPGWGPTGGPAGAPERLLVAIAALGTVAALFLFRGADDNRLTSWSWVFAGADPVRLYALAAAGIALVLMLARFPLPRWPAAVLFVASCAAAAPFWRAPEVIVDSSRYFTQAKHLELYGLGYFLAQWGRQIPAWTDLPLVPLLYGLVFRVLGESRICIQAATTLLFAGCVVLTHRLGKTLWDEEVGFTAGAFLLAMPYLLTQVPAMLVDVPAMFFMALAVLAAVKAVREGGTWRVLLASLAVALAFFTKYSAWLLLSVLPVIWVVHRKGGAARPLRTGAATAAFSAAIVLPELLWRHQVYRDQIALLLAYQAPGLRRWGESFTSTFLFQIHPFVTAAALLSVWVAARRRDARYAIALWPVLLLLALRVHRIRYFVPAFPMLALMAAYGLRRIGSGEVRRLVAGCAVATSLLVALGGYLPFLEGVSAANVMRAGEYLDAIGEARVEVLTPLPPDPELNPATYVAWLDLYTAKKIVYAYQAPPPPPRERLEASALRFTWEYRNPGYYAADGGSGGAAVAVIADDLTRTLPAPLEARLRGYRLARVFAADEGVFRARTLVGVWRAAEPRRGGARADR